MAFQRGKDKKTVKRDKKQSTTKQRGWLLDEVVPNFPNHERQASYLALQKAFNDVSAKLLQAQEDRSILQSENAALCKENEALKQSLEKGFKAYDDKYKETEDLRKKLHLKEKLAVDKESNNDELIKEEHIGESQDISNENDEIQKTCRSSYTEDQNASQERISYRNILEECGMEIVHQDNKSYLILTNRQKFQCWLEKDTEGKATVDFNDNALVTERLAKNSDSDEPKGDLSNRKESQIIMSQKKIAEQASMIKDLRKRLQQCTPSTHIGIYTDHKEISSSQQSLKRYHQAFLAQSRELANQVNILKNQLNHQKMYTKRLVHVINGRKEMQKQVFLLSNFAHENIKRKEKLEKSKEPANFPVVEEQFDDDSRGIEEGTVGSALYSMAVQESDSLSLPTCSSSPSVITLPESKSSTGDMKSTAMFSSTRGPSNIELSSDTVEEERALEKDEKDEAVENEVDDFEVISEESIEPQGASGLKSSVKQCPVCFISFTPAHTQEEFEAHVVGHFKD